MFDDWVFGYGVDVSGHGYVKDFSVRHGWIVFTDDYLEALVCETHRDAVLVQHWALNLLTSRASGARVPQVGTVPFVLSYRRGV